MSLDVRWTADDVLASTPLHIHLIRRPMDRVQSIKMFFSAKTFDMRKGFL